MTDDRLRDPPRERFAARQRVIDLAAEFASLPAQSVERRGQMQKTIHKHGRLTSAVFDLEPGAGLESHKVEGEAILHVLEGRVVLTSSEGRREAAAGHLVLLDPGVEHAIEATEAARVLMHVVLEGRDP